ncbi:hypothetical protein [Mucilaginibacter jinjuensis]|uniref:DUF4421 domain-containing protein n=1 Tax=Mucilaginibacter jinjuensis TaxID=1176721 RepID=A0ABY7TAJ7_9SPHI|nr:hypothetical protein [Mucilaginibacter jinjuensis]WCT13529.1 hypothetical protein PQO05_06215 [Mucilaginibacter jinjuensis]
MNKYTPAGLKSAALASLLFLLLTSVCSAQGNLYAQNNTVSSRQPKAFADAAANTDTTITTYKKVKPVRTVPWFVDKFKLTAGFFAPVNNTNIRVNGTNGKIGTDIDFEDDLGFNKNTSTFLGDFQWRSSSRSRFDFSYYRLDRSSSYQIQKDINFNGNTYNIGAQIDAYFNSNIYRLSYGYAILSKPDYEAGLLIGAHVVRFGIGIAATGNNISGSASTNVGLTAPLPDFGLWGGWTMGKRWAFNAEADYLDVTIDNISGRIIAYNAAVTFRAIKNLTFAAGYTGLNFKVDVDREKLDGELKWGYNGPSVTATFTFGRKGWNVNHEMQ